MCYGMSDEDDEDSSRSWGELVLDGIVELLSLF
jgi:hypothetical protein